MTMLARLAGEKALQAERSGLVAADDDRGGDGDFPSSRAVHTRLSQRERAVICLSLATVARGIEKPILLVG
jgi:hypothetical protein